VDELSGATLKFEMESNLTIQDREYPLGTVVLDIWERAEAGVEVVFVLRSETGDAGLASRAWPPETPLTAGFLLAGVAVEGVFLASGIYGLEVEIDAGSPHGGEALGECVVFEPGRKLWVECLWLRFGDVDSGMIPVEMTARCGYCGSRPAKADVIVTAKFIAQVRIRRPYSNTAEMLQDYYEKHGYQA